MQRQLKADIFAAWNSAPQPSNVVAVAATGFGKTVLFSDIIYDASGYSVVMAHRQELVSQSALSLAKNGIRHAIIAPDKVRRIIQSVQIAELGRSFYDANARCKVGGVLSLNNLPDEPWMKQCQIGIGDEGHHVLRDNEWGKFVSRIASAYWLLPTATPSRADGAGLGRHHDGLADHLVQAPGMREVIDAGFLTDYRYIGFPVSDIVMTDDDISETTGDYNQTKLRAKHHASKKIVGDVVEAYMQFAKGKLGVTFAVDVEEATKISRAFNDRGIKAEVVSAKTPDDLRFDIIRRFRRRDVLQLVNVDLFGEGFDLPAIEVVSFARHTASFGLYTQQWGRALRLMLPEHLRDAWDSFTPAERKAHIAASDKPRAIVIDHVNNLERHMGPPDALWRGNQWTLDRIEKAKRRRNLQPIQMCKNKDTAGTGLDESPCGQYYEKFLISCPYCGHAPILPERKAPEHVHGDPFELDDEALAALRGAISNNLDADPKYPFGASAEIIGAAHKRHWEKKQAHAALRNAMMWWAAFNNAQGRSDAEAHRRFYFAFGIDTMSAQTLGRAEMQDLYVRVATELGKCGINAGLDANTHLLYH